MRRGTVLERFPYTHTHHFRSQVLPVTLLNNAEQSSNDSTADSTSLSVIFNQKLSHLA